MSVEQMDGQRIVIWFNMGLWFNIEIVVIQNVDEQRSHRSVDVCNKHANDHHASFHSALWRNGNDMIVISSMFRIIMAIIIGGQDKYTSV